MSEKAPLPQLTLKAILDGLMLFSMRCNAARSA